MLVATVATLAYVPVPAAWLEGVFLACWLSIVITAATVHLPHGLNLWAALLLSLNAGVWLSAIVALTGSRAELFQALPCVLVFLPAGYLINQRASIGVKIASSWLIAIALLAATLQFLPVTPGYMPDHLE